MAALFETKTIAGRVTDENGEDIIGANVVVKSTSTGIELAENVDFYSFGNFADTYGIYSFFYRLGTMYWPLLLTQMILQKETSVV